MHPCPDRVAIRRVVVYYVWAACAFNAGIKCQHCRVRRWFFLGALVSSITFNWSQFSKHHGKIPCSYPSHQIWARYTISFTYHEIYERRKTLSHIYFLCYIFMNCIKDIWIQRSGNAIESNLNSLFTNYELCRNEVELFEIF